MNKFGYKFLRFMRLSHIMALCLAVAGGCASPQIRARSIHSEQVVLRADTALSEALFIPLKGNAGRTTYLLALSGGGAWGAWGAGVLKGWNERHDIPKFDVVTGISTGALSATPAFLGDYQLLEHEYTDVKTSDIIRPKFLGCQFLAMLFCTSIYDTSPLRQRIARSISNRVIDRVAEEYPKRRLYVGTASLSDGKFYIWDMTYLAWLAHKSHDQKGYEKYRSVLLASASIPMAMSPTDIEGETHVDGGAREQLFWREGLLPALAEMKNRLAQFREGGPATRASVNEELFHGLSDKQMAQMATDKVEIYAIVNGKLGVTNGGTYRRAFRIGIRAVGIMEDAGMVSDLYMSQMRAKSIKNCEFRFLAVPDDGPTLDSEKFEGSQMKALLELGTQYGKDQKWGTQVLFPDVLIGPKPSELPRP